MKGPCRSCAPESHPLSNNLQDCCFLLADSAPGIQKRAFHLEEPLSDSPTLPSTVELPKLRYNSDGQSFGPAPRPSRTPEYPSSDKWPVAPQQDVRATWIHKNTRRPTV